MKKTFLTYLFFWGLFSSVTAQIPDSVLNPPTRNMALDSILNKIENDTSQIAIQADTLLEKKKKFRILGWLKEDYPDPKKGLILSAVPGLGQAYNKKYWKIPIVYAAIGGLIYTVDYNSGQYRRLQTAYLAKVDGDESTISEFEGTPIGSASTLKNLRDNFDKNRQLSWIGLVVVYALNGVDAFVDGHLLNFDIDEDLSMRIKPNLDVNIVTAQPVIGLGLSFSLK